MTSLNYKEAIYRKTISGDSKSQNFHNRIEDIKMGDSIVEGKL